MKKRLVHTLIIIVLLPIVLIVLLALALYCPPIQNWAVQKATAYASEETGMDISIGNVRLTFPLNLQLNEVKVDTVAEIHSLLVDIQLWPLLEQQVMVDALEFKYMKVNTAQFIEAAHIKGSLKTLRVESHGIDLKKELVRLDKAKIYGADLDIELNDSVPEDTTKTELFWKIHSDIVQVSSSKIRLKGMGMNLTANVKNLKAENGDFDLHKNEYKLAHAELKDGAFTYALLETSNLQKLETPNLQKLENSRPRNIEIPKPLVSISETYAAIDSIYFCAPNISAQIASLRLKEGRGTNLKHLQGKIAIDSTSVHVNDLRLETPYSELRLGMNMDFSVLDEHNPGKVQLAFDGKLGKGDIIPFASMPQIAAMLPKGFLNKLPNQQIELSGAMKGNLIAAEVDKFYVGIPNILSLNAFGDVSNPTDLNRLKTNINATFDCKNIDFLTQFVDPNILAGTGLKMPKGLPLTASLKLNGGMNSMMLEDLKVKVPGYMNLYAKGKVLNLNNMSRFVSDLNLNFEVPSLDFLVNCIDPKMLAGTGVKIPHGIGLKGKVGMKGDNYLLDLTATEGGGWLKLKGDINLAQQKYNVDAQAHQLAVNHFMPSLGVGRVSATAKANGKGYDPFLSSTNIKAKADIQSLQYDNYHLANMQMDADIARQKASAHINSHNEYLNGQIDVDALMSTKILRATLAGDIAKVNFHKLGFTELPMYMGMCTHVDVDYDFKNNIMVRGLLSDVSIVDTAKVYRPDDIVMDILSTNDTTRARIDCGDLYVHLNAKGGYNSLLEKATKLSDIIVEDLQQQTIDINRLWSELPLMKLDMRAGKDNPLSRLVTYKGVAFDDADIHLESAPMQGVNGNIAILGTRVEDMQLDTISLRLRSNEKRCVFAGQVRNSKDNPQFTFNTLLRGELKEHGIQARMTIKDAKERVGLRFGADAEMVEDGIRVTVLEDENTILGYQKFSVNKDNYLLLNSENRLSANMKLRSSDGKGIGIYTNDDNTDAMQDITLTLSKINLQEILSSIPYAPDIRGILEGDYHYVQEDDKFTVSTSSTVNKLNYAGLDIGNVSTDLVYMPEDDGSHHVDGILFMEDEEVCSLVGSYNMTTDSIDAIMTMKEMPMHLANGFIPDQIFGLKGKGDGELSIKGSTAKPSVNGEIFLEDCHIYSTPYGVDLRFSDDPVRIKNSRLLLENFEMFAYNNNPLVIAGYLDFADMSKMFMDIKMRADNYGIINAKENVRSEVYGKAFVDFYGTMTGRVDNLSMRGKLEVLPNTDLSYILRDSPINTDNHLDELVKFVNMEDTTTVHTVDRPSLYGLNMDMTVNIASGARIMAYLNTSHTNYVDLTGNGSLRMTYNPADELKLTGRYNLGGGQMKYSLPVIPLKTFSIKQGSYVEFTGDIMNPRLNITATELNKAQVDNGTGARTVEFECGVVITKTLQDMGLEFTLDAPEDLELKSDLATMSMDMRGKLAVTMLTTGMYLAEENMSTFSMNTALNQFLQGEINNITGNALRTLNLSIGLDNTTDKTGESHMDYSFKFAKRFLNNRLKVSVGGKVSTGGTMDKGQNNSFFDNLEVEYRLDKNGSKFLNLFFDNNSYDWLEGNTQEFGGGFIWRRSMMNFLDLFKSLTPSKEPQDTIKNDTQTP